MFPRAIETEPAGDAAIRSQIEALNALIRQAAQERASDVHLRAGTPPRIRVDGELLQVKGFIPTAEGMRRFFAPMVTDEQFRNFERLLELDFSHVIRGVCRIRTNLYQEREVMCAAMRMIPEAIPSMEEIGLPPACVSLTTLDRGLVLVTGPTGSGKSTTLAAMINHINATRRCHIHTIEDPIEYYYDEKKAFITQREVERDTRTFSGALRHAFRQDPDVVLIGEMRDTETMQTAITLGETGHLTFSTLHTGDAAQTVNRIIDSMPAHQRDQIRVQLSNSLAGVISQRLIPRRDQKGRVAAREIMICNRAIRNLIREGKTHQILSAIQTGVEEGMITMSASLADLVRGGFLEMESARMFAEDPKDFAAKLSGR